MSFIAGQYTATLGNVSIGATREGYEFRASLHEAPIQTDETGAAEIDGTDQGGDVMIRLDWCEYDKVVAAIGDQTPALEGLPLANVGKLQSGLAQTLVLTPVSGTTATQKLTATKARVVSDLQFLMNSKLRQGPLTLKLLPDLTLSGADAGRTHKFETVTP